MSNIASWVSNIASWVSNIASWLPMATVGSAMTILGCIKLWGLKQGIVGGGDKPFMQRLCGA